MAATYSIEKLSGSTDGKGIKVTGTTSGTGVTLHTVGSGTGDIEIPKLWVANQDSNGDTVTLHLGWGGTTDPDNVVSTPISNKLGFIPVALDVILMNSLSITAWASVANSLIVYGHVFKVDKP